MAKKTGKAVKQQKAGRASVRQQIIKAVRKSRIAELVENELGRSADRLQQGRAHRCFAGGDPAIQPGDGRRRVDPDRAVLGAASVGVAGVAAASGGDCPQNLGPLGVALVIQKRPGAVEGRRTQVVRIPGDHVAGGQADGTVDALDAGVGGLALGAFR